MVNKYLEIAVNLSAFSFLTVTSAAAANSLFSEIIKETENKYGKYLLDGACVTLFVLFASGISKSEIWKVLDNECCCVEEDETKTDDDDVN